MTVQRVNPPALTSQAAEMKGQNWHNPAEDAVAPPDALPSTNDAIANLNENAQSLKEFEEWAKIENQRIAETLDIAAAAYQQVDEAYGTALENPERATAIDAISVPSPQTPPPEIPGPASTPRLLDASAYSDVKKTQAELDAPDEGASLKNAMLYWLAASNRVENNKPKPPPGDWEGEAADAAYARMTTFGSWLTQLSDAWYDLGEAASKILSAHDKAKAAHAPIYQEYIELEARLQELASRPGPQAGIQRQIELAHQRMEELQAQSEEVRQEYASGATFSPVRPADPPFKPADSSAPSGGGGGHGSGGGGDQPAGDTAAMAQKMSESLGTGQQEQGAGQGGGSGGGSPSGSGSPSGGEGSGGGAGGSDGGGSPTSSPRMPTDPSLRPAAGGGSGGGSGGGVGGGGAGSAPLSPAVSAETVAPAPPMPVAAGTAAAAAAPAGMAGGGMGGMAPMHGAQGAQQGKEKRRDPRTAPDEDLYVEDRPWTEGVVGNRRRREVHEGRQLERDDDQDDDE